MTLRSRLKQLFEKTGFTIYRLPDHGRIYDRDGLRSLHNHEFLDDPEFQRAYARGERAGADYHWQWRVHIGLWAAHCASKLAGDFVECGVNRGFMSSAIMEYLDWDRTGRTFYLLDTFSGIDPRYITPEEADSGAMQRNEQLLQSGFYVKGVDAVRRNFAQWKNVRIIEGAIPETLSQIDSPRVAFLHLDMNCAPPEVAALEHLWGRLAPGAIVLFDDYAYDGYRPQKVALDALVRPWDVKIASLPTGQGLLLKPAG